MKRLLPHEYPSKNLIADTARPPSSEGSTPSSGARTAQQYVLLRQQGLRGLIGDQGSTTRNTGRGNATLGSGQTEPACDAGIHPHDADDDERFVPSTGTTDGHTFSRGGIPTIQQRAVLTDGLLGLEGRLVAKTDPVAFGGGGGGCRIGTSTSTNAAAAAAVMCENGPVGTESIQDGVELSRVGIAVDDHPRCVGVGVVGSDMRGWDE
mmetsp:Transcript_33149/g.97793  ORF Transcript_33149/g.97793 Transcript_33149/m.97793 type:complete len:208 (-) Transcript_33149:1067-1690(-)